jgi:RNA polymerase sigma factor (sigma-70 family)
MSEPESPDAPPAPALPSAPDTLDDIVAELYHPDLLDVIRRALGPRLDRFDHLEDVRQQLAARLVAGRHNQAGTPAPSCVRAFVFTSARNEASNVRRNCFAHKRDPSREVRLDCIVRDPEQHPPDRSPDPLQHAAFIDMLACLHRDCEPLEQSVLALRLEGCDRDEISDRLGIPVKAVDQATQRLRQLIFALQQ